jgi:hypothetical protein
MVNYLAKVAKVRDQLVSIGKKVENKNMVFIALNGIAPSWKPLSNLGVCACENFSNFAKIWDNLL